MPLIGCDEMEEFLECFAVGRVRSGCGLLAGGGDFDRDEGEADTIFAIADHLRHHNDGGLRCFCASAGSLESHHDKRAQQPALRGGEIESGMADVLNCMGNGASAVPEVGDKRGGLAAIILSSVTRKKRLQPFGNWAHAASLSTAEGILEFTEQPAHAAAA